MSTFTSVPPAGRAALALFADAPLTLRLHVQARWRTCPLAEIAARVPTRGAVLDVGCGHGLFASYLALEAADRRVVGVDLDDRKLADAATVVERVRERGGSLTLQVAPGGAVPDGPWDAITIVDVLYLLPAAAQRDLVERAAALLAAGGRLLVKEMAPVPAWKARWNRAQETLAVKVVGFTASESTGFTFVPPAEMRGWLEAWGLDVAEVPLDRGYLHPHHLLVGSRPGPAPAPGNSVDPRPAV
ncbi:MAG: class I SAM-dependent methyltransferase [Acidimicrobiia bacterium]